MAANTASHIEELLALIVDEKGFVSEGDCVFVFRRLREKLENRLCFDCHNRNPAWLSLTFGVFLCITCSGRHRRMGTQISFVRSCELDKFTRDQLIRMELGGNGRALTFFRSHGSTKPDFCSELARQYKDVLDRACQQQLMDNYVSSSTSPPVMNLYSTAAIDATLGLTPVIAGRQSPPYSNSGSSSSSSVPSLNVVTNSRYANAKSISSAELFGNSKQRSSGEETQGSRRGEASVATSSRFNDCKAISSEAFHAGDPTPVANKNSGRIFNGTPTARSTIKVLASGAQQTVATARNWFNNFVSEEKRSSKSSRQQPQFSNSDLLTVPY